MNWDDLKVFIAVARHKKLSDAASQLKIDVTTISRRIKRLEDNLGQTLFERLRSGHQLTPHGEKLLVTAEDVENSMEKLTSSKNQQAHKASGIIRMSVAEGFGAEVLSPLLSEFRTLFPDIEVDLVSGSGFLSLSKREADVAIGLSRSKSKHIHSELLTSYSLHLYAQKTYLETHPKINSIEDLHHHTLIDYVDDLIYSDELKYFQEYLPNHRPEIRSTSIMAQKKLVEHGAGIAILPDFLAPNHLVKVLAETFRIERQFWFSCHQSVAPLAKVKAFKKFAFEHILDSN